MLKAYCDESHSGDPEQTSLYVVAGLIGVPEQWEYFESIWRQTMKELGITKIGSHAAKCAVGGGPYREMTKEARLNILYRLTVDIAASDLFGAVAVIDMDGYRKHRDALVSMIEKRSRQYYKPHVRAVEQCVWQMAKAVPLSMDDEIAFVFDQGPSSGAARAALEIAKKNADYPYAHRIGPIAVDDRLKAVGLQAADLLTYYAYRHACGKNDLQWQQLLSGMKQPPITMTTGDDFWNMFVAKVEAKRAELATAEV